MTEFQDLESLRSDLAFETQTRGERFARISQTEPDDPEHVALLTDDFDPPVDHSIMRVIDDLIRTVAGATVTNARMMKEVGHSLGFDMRAIASLAEKVAEQEHEIEMLRRAVEDLRRR